jgi:tail collar domain
MAKVVKRGTTRRTTGRPAKRAVGEKPLGVRAPAAGSGFPYLGQIEIFAFRFAPVGWAQCQGQLLPIAQNQALFSLIGLTYGGNGMTTFALPNLKPLGPSGPGYYIYISPQATFPPR